MSYVLLSDTHCHNWSAFSTTLPSGVNSRLQIILDEINRAAVVAKRDGHNTMVIAGDIFHVRGSIAPSVLNPVLDQFDFIVNNMGIEVIAIPGNHDLESKNANALTNGAGSLAKVGVRMINKSELVHTVGGDKLIMIPWFDLVADLKAEINEWADRMPDESCDLIIHAPVDGVIMGIPDHGLDADWLSGHGFNRVFSGHYHNHVDFDNDVYSIGATTHQTWSDTNSKAGFLVVDEGVAYCATNAPKFFTITDDTDEDELPLLVDGNYVRATIEIEKDSQVLELREALMEMGARGVTINVLKKTSVVSRTGATVKSGASLLESLGEFIKARECEDKKALTAMCSQILSEAEAA